MGFFMVPENQMWNYSFTGLGVVQNMKYGLILSTPKDFYHEIHRSSHFLSFNKMDDEIDQDVTEVENHFE